MYCLNYSKISRHLNYIREDYLITWRISYYIISIIMERYIFQKMINMM